MPSRRTSVSEPNPHPESPGRGRRGRLRGPPCLSGQSSGRCWPSSGACWSSGLPESDAAAGVAGVVGPAGTVVGHRRPRRPCRVPWSSGVLGCRPACTADHHVPATATRGGQASRCPFASLLPPSSGTDDTTPHEAQNSRRAATEVAATTPRPALSHVQGPPRLVAHPDHHEWRERSCSSTTRKPALDARGGPAPLGLRGPRRATRAGRRSAPWAVEPDLVVLDVMLPDLDGFEVCRRWRQEGSRTPVVFLTARDATEDKVRGLTHGGDDYLVKPFSLEELVARIQAVLRRTGAARNGDGAVLQLRRPRARRRRPPRDPGRRGGRPVADRVQPAALPARQPGPGRVARPRSSTTSGSTTSAATAAWSRPTSATCAARSTPREPRLIHTIRGVGYTLRERLEVSLARPAARSASAAGAPLVLVVGGASAITRARPSRLPASTRSTQQLPDDGPATSGPTPAADRATTASARTTSACVDGRRPSHVVRSPDVRGPGHDAADCRHRRRPGPGGGRRRRRSRQIVHASGRPTTGERYRGAGRRRRPATGSVTVVAALARPTSTPPSAGWSRVEVIATAVVLGHPRARGVLGAAPRRAAAQAT